MKCNPGIGGRAVVFLVCPLSAFLRNRGTILRTVISVGCLIFPNAVSCGPILRPVCLYHPKALDSENSRISFLLNNSGDSVLCVESVCFLECLVWPPVHDGSSPKSPVFWCNVWPSEVKPGGLVEVAFLPKERPVDGATVIVNYVVQDTRRQVVRKLPKPTTGLHWAGITFSNAPSRVFVALRWEGERRSKISSISVNCEEISEEFFSEIGFLLKGRTVVVPIEMQRKWRFGEDVFVVCRAENGEEAATRVRANPNFVIADTSANVRSTSLCEGQGHLNIRSALLDENSKALNRLLLGCPMHHCESPEKAAWKSVEEYGKFRRLWPESLNYIYVCNFQQHQGLSLFSGLADGVMFFPYKGVNVGQGGLIKKATFRTACFAYQCCCPKPWYAAIGITSNSRFPSLRERSPSRREVELQVWTALSCGAKGLLYRGSKGDLRCADVNSVNEVIKSLLPGLSYAIPISTFLTPEKRARVSVLQMGDNELLLIVLNNTFAFCRSDMPYPCFELIRNLNVTVNAPVGYRILDKEDSSANLAAAAGKKSYCLQINQLKHFYLTRIPITPMRKISCVARTEREKRLSK